MNLKRTAYRLLLLVLGAVAAISAFQMGSPFFARQLPREAPKFYDFRLWHGSLVRYEKLQTLYTTNQKGYFLAGSRVGYKYPPTYASLIRPFMGKPIPVIERYFLIANLIAILAAGAGLMVALGLRGDRLLLAIPVFVLWRPTWETLSDLQMEVPILLCLAIAALFAARSRVGVGAALGVAGAFKVYPWVFAAPFLLARRWKLFLGLCLGAIVTIGLSGLSIPLRNAYEFFFQVMPKLGGVSLSYENVSLPATIGRIVIWLTGRRPSAEDLDGMHLEQDSMTKWISFGIVAAVLGTIAFFTFRRTRTSRAVWNALPERRRVILMLCAGVLGTLALIPTSWLSYQCLLAMPLLVSVAWVRPSDRVSVVLLLGAITIGSVLYSYGVTFDRHPAAFSTFRTVLPYLLASVLARSSDSGPVTSPA